MKIINPATSEVITEVSSDTEEQIANKFKLLKQGQSEWSKVSVKKRIEYIQKFGELIKNNLNNLAELLTKETGKPIAQSRNEIRGSLNRIQHIGANAENILAEKNVKKELDFEGVVTYEPLGVIVNISAWNYPYNVGYNVFLYALAAGNAVLYKPSEYATLTGLKFQKYLYEAGIPENVFQCVIGGGEVGAFLLKLNVDGYFFTGSYATGKKINEAVASKLVPVQLELGGKDPLYIAEDVVDIQQAAVNAAEGAFYNNGQSCCSVERIYVAASIYNEFISAFVDEVRNYKIGDPLQEDTFVGPLARKQQVQLLEKQVEDAICKGATLQYGGHPLSGKSNYFMPTVLTDCNPDMLVMKEESFGPIIGIQKVASDDQALSLMQNTEYGLTAAVFSGNKQRALQILKELNTGTVYWNCCDSVDPDLPWSGRKNSGLGVTLSFEGIRAFVHPKAYHLKQL